jgi:hypothetical protein
MHRKKKISEAICCANNDLDKARRDLAADVEAFLEAGNGIDVIEQPSTEEVIEELGSKIRPLLNKKLKFK